MLFSSIIFFLGTFVKSLVSGWPRLIKWIVHFFLFGDINLTEKLGYNNFVNQTFWHKYTKIKSNKLKSLDFKSNDI